MKITSDPTVWGPIISKSLLQIRQRRSHLELLTLVHAVVPRRDERSQLIHQNTDLRQCRTTERLLDVRISGRSMFEIGTGKKNDATQFLDLICLERLIRLANQRVLLPMPELCDTFLDSDHFVFAHQLEHRGYEIIDSRRVKNAVKRANRVLRRGGIVPVTPTFDRVVVYRHRRGYEVDLAAFRLILEHIVP